MKKIVLVLLFALSAAVYSCGSEGQGNQTAAPKAEVKKDADAEKGLALVAKSDCLTCHQIVEPGIGPSYTAIAERYPVNDAVIDSLSNKILNGGAGNWGSVYMNAHPDLSKDDAKLMVKYVLSLKNQ